jgi:hypothetical protein
LIALALGGARCVWADLAAAQALLGTAEYRVVVANMAGITHTGRMDAWATVHPEAFDGWRAQRAAAGLSTDYVAFTPPNPPEAWAATSGLYAAQVAVTRLGCTGVVLCGMPMTDEGGSIYQPGPWNAHDRYRSGARKAHHAAAPIIRSMSGWTCDLFGTPSGEWIARNSGL